MKASSKLFLTALLGLSASTIANASEPRPMERPDPEHMQVTGSRIRTFGLGDVNAFMESTEFRTLRGAGGAPASEASVNAQGEQKAEKAKKAADAKTSNFWNPAVWIRSALQSISVHVNGTFKVEYFDENGRKRVGVEGCLNNSINKENKETCSSVEMGKTPDGKNIISIHKLIAVKKNFTSYQLVYSTDDTITLIYESEDELINFFRGIDPNFSL